MLKQLLTAGIISAGLMATTPLLAYGNNNGGHGASNNHRCMSGNKIDRRQANQRNQIKRGERKGQLVRWEVKKLQRMQRDIKRVERQMRKSGRCLTKREVRKLDRKLDRAGRTIRKLNNNRFRTYNRHNRR